MPGQGRRNLAAVAAMAVLAISPAACGSSSKAGASHQSGASSSARAGGGAAASSAAPTSARSPSVTTGPVRATLHGADHSPRAGKPWFYSVAVHDATGHPLEGTVETDFVVAGFGVVGKETPAIHRLRHGKLRDNVTFPAQAIGHQITLVTVVRARAGSVALGWTVSVKR